MQLLYNQALKCYTSFTSYNFGNADRINPLLLSAEREPIVLVTENCCLNPSSNNNCHQVPNEQKLIFFNVSGQWLYMFL